MKIIIIKVIVLVISIAGVYLIKKRKDKILSENMGKNEKMFVKTLKSLKGTEIEDVELLKHWYTSFQLLFFIIVMMVVFGRVLENFF